MTAAIRTLLFVLVLSLVGNDVVAQQVNPLSLSSGDEIRVWEDQEGWVGAEVDFVDDTGITYSVAGRPGTRVLPYVEIDTIAVKRRIPRYSAILSGSWGLFLGTSIGAISGPFAANATSLGTGGAMAAFAVAGGVSGAAIGGALGAILAPPRWYRHVFR